METVVTQLEAMTGPLIRAGVTLVLGWGAARLFRRALRSAVERNSHLLLVHRIGTYVIVGVAMAWALSELGLDITVLLGAAGVLTVAVGFASQTSASNFISGLFLMVERPFVRGDVIAVEGIIGEVLSIDLMSVKVRTFDNLFVRIPNESMIKSSVTNHTHFPIRRYDLKMGVAYKEDIDRVRTVLFALADRNPLCLREPTPLFIFRGFGDSSLDFQFSVWAEQANYLTLRNTIHEDVKRSFDTAGIEIPFPQRTLHAGSTTDPFPVRLVPETP